MSRVRVSTLAKELGIPSREAVAWINANGEYVKSAASTIDAAVEGKLRRAFPPHEPTLEERTVGRGSRAVDKVPAAQEPVVHDLDPMVARRLINALDLAQDERVLLVAKHAESFFGGERVMLATTTRILDKRGQKPAPLSNYDRIQDSVGLVGVEDEGQRLVVLVFSNGLRCAVEHAAPLPNTSQTNEIRAAFRMALAPLASGHGTRSGRAEPEAPLVPLPDGSKHASADPTQERDGAAAPVIIRESQTPPEWPPDGSRHTWCRPPETQREREDIEDLLEQLEGTDYIHAFLCADFSGGRRQNQVDVVILCPSQLWGIEVKSHEGNLEADVQNWWMVPDRGPKKLIDNPYRQASGNAKALASVLKKRMTPAPYVDQAVWIPRISAIRLAPELREWVFGNAPAELRPAYELVAGGPPAREPSGALEVLRQVLVPASR